MKKIILSKKIMVIIVLVLGMFFSQLGMDVELITVYAATPGDENFDSTSTGYGSSPRTIGSWTFAVFKADGSNDEEAYLDVLSKPEVNSPLSPTSGDNILIITGYYDEVTPSNNGKIVQIKSTSGDEFKIISFHIDGGIDGDGNSIVISITGYRDGSPVTAEKAITAPVNTDTEVSFTGAEWECIDEIRMERQDGVADIAAWCIDDISVSDPVLSVTAHETAISEAASLDSLVGDANTITLTVKNSDGSTDTDFDGNKSVT
ncbi:hypothetical protein, partial [Vallitalea maricola]|uniref:hypothetical protein n=1 Tax=Vallitalea maricola TaxID=3074433 RepID=UPI0030DAD29E